jgi:hypothetical protein
VFCLTTPSLSSFFTLSAKNASCGGRHRRTLAQCGDTSSSGSILHRLVVYGRVCSEPGPKHIGSLGNNPPQFGFLFGRQPVLHRSLQQIVDLDLHLCSALVADFDVVIVLDSILVRRVLVAFRVLDGGSSTSFGSRAGSSSSESPSSESASFGPRAQLSPLGISYPTRLAIRRVTNCSFVSNFLVRSCGAITRGQSGSGRVAYRACPLRRCSCLQCVILVDRVPGRSTWGSPTMNKHPWTPGGSKGARGLLSVPYRSPVVSIVLACPPDRSPEDQFDLRRRMDKLCTARVYMPYKEFTVRSGRARESAASPASPDDAPHTASASNSAQSAPSARAAARPSLSTCKAVGKRPSPVFGVTQSADGGILYLSIKPPTPTPAYVDVY